MVTMVAALQFHSTVNAIHELIKRSDTRLPRNTKLFASYVYVVPIMMRSDTLSQSLRRRVGFGNGTSL